MKIFSLRLNNLLKTLILILFFSSCNNEIVQGSNIIGNWKNSVSKSMGGYEISSNFFLSIRKTNDGQFNYTYEVYVSDQMYGTKNKLMDKGSGKLSDEVSEKKWMFETGILSNKKSYIIVPDDNWKDYKPNTILISHGFQRGSDQLFKKNN